MRFWKGDDIADGIRSGQQHGQSVESEGDAAMRGSAELQGVEKKTKLEFGFFLINAKKFEHLLLDFFLMNTDTAAGDFVAVQHQIVGTGANFFGGVRELF